MATKAAAAKKSAAKKGTSIVKWDEALAARAKMSQSVASNLGTGSNFVSFQGGIMKYKGNPVEGNSMQVVVPSFILENAYYVGKYDPNNPASPVCYAFGTDQKEMEPHEKSTQPQAEKCKGCPQNEWNTSDTGRGKACKNIVRLGLIPADALENGAQGVKDAEEAIAKLPVTSGGAWGGYVSSLEAAKLPPLAFVTEMSETPDAKNQFAVNFKAVEQIDDGEIIGALLERAEIMDKTLAAPYPDTEEAASARKPAGKAAGRGFAGAAKKPAGKTPPVAGKKAARKF